MIIYKVQNKINNKIYIGLTTKDLSKRIAEHISENKSYFQKALNKYGIQSFTVEVIDSAESKEILCEKEKYWIQHYNSKAPNGYNLTDGGDGLINPTRSVRNKISKKVSKILQGNNRRQGIFHSKEVKQRISDTLKVSLNDPKVKAKISRSHKGIPKSEEWKQKMRKPKSEEHKKKIGDSHRGRYRGCSEKTLQKMGAEKRRLREQKIIALGLQGKL